MPDIVFWILFGWMMVALIRRPHGTRGRSTFACGSGRDVLGREARHRLEVEGASRAPRRTPHARVGRGQPGVYRQPSSTPTREEREGRLRARYVSGEITVEQYENGLDELYRRP